MLKKTPKYEADSHLPDYLLPVSKMAKIKAQLGKKGKEKVLEGHG